MIMISKNEIKIIKSLTRKKYRESFQSFIVEGYKSIRECHDAGLHIERIYTTAASHELDDLQPIVITDREMKAISNLTTPPGYLAVIKMPVLPDVPDKGLFVALDGIQDPGNLGTIIRLADWFDIKHILCHHGTVDLYNPKCIQATMGSLARVNVHYIDLPKFLSQTKLPVLIATMSQTSIYDHPLPPEGILVMGGESHGVSHEIVSKGKAISIPQYSSLQERTESLNVATATAIILAEWRRSIGT